MTFKLTVESFHGKQKGLVLHGPYVTHEVWQWFKNKMGYALNTPFYDARKKANAFFQGGSNSPNEQWVFIELGSDHEEFVAYVNQAMEKLIIPSSTEIRINLYAYPDPGSLDLCLMIAEEANSPYGASGWGTPFRFKPETSTQYNEVMDLIQCFKLTVV